MPFYEYYDELTALKISKIYAEDINKFGYDMNDTFSQIKLRDAPVQLDTFLRKICILTLIPMLKRRGWMHISTSSIMG